MNQPVLRLMIVAIIFSCPVFGQSSDAPEAAPKEKYRQALGLLTGSATAQADRDQAMSLLQSAAEHGYAPAQTALGTIYARAGGAVPRDMAKAVEWFTKAAEHDDWIAQLALGRIYFMGDGVPQDSARARQWLFRAAATGDGVSAWYLGVLYDGRLGATADRSEAARWYRQSAEAGNPYAQEKLANLYYKGLGVGQDQKEAYIWYLVAEGFGNSAASIRVNSIDLDLSPMTVKATREAAGEQRRHIMDRKAKNPCSGWPGEYDLRPTAPPLAYLAVCEK